MGWIFLALAIVSELTGTLSMRMATTGAKAWYALTAAGYVAAFTLLSFALDDGVPLGMAYGIWSAAGVALTAVLSRLLFDEPLTKLMAAGIAVIALGVLLIELGADH